MLDRYLENPNELTATKLEAPYKHRRNYELFGLHPEEKEILHKIKNKRRNFLNPSDPYFMRCSR